MLFFIPLSNWYLITLQISERTVASSTFSSSNVFKSIYCFPLFSKYTKYHSLMGLGDYVCQSLNRAKK